MRTRLEAALERIRDSRSTTERMIEDVRGDEWFWHPGEGMNHIAWHLGHLAFAQYFLCLKRQRDRTIEDESLITTQFLKRYKQGSVPTGDPAANSTVEEIRSV